MKKRLCIALRSPWFWAIAAGYVLRIVAMPITGQHDVMFMPWMSHYINQGHPNLYAFLHEQFGDIVMQRPAIWAPYPYGFYLLTAGWLGLLERLRLVDLTAWQSVWQVPHAGRLVFLSKLAYLPFDLGIGYILCRTWGRTALAFWAWSALAIYTPFMMGQNDVYATAFALAGTYAASRAIQNTARSPPTAALSPNKWAILTSILLGVGSIFKIFPLLLLPPLVLVVEKRWWQRLFLLCVGCSFLAVASVPFMTTPTYVNGVLFNPEGMGILQETELLGIRASPFLVGYSILLGYLMSVDRPSNHSPHVAWFASLIVMAILFLWVPAPIYWLIWIVPLLIGAMGRVPKLSFAWVTLQLAFALGLLNEHPELGVALPIHLASMFNVPNLPTALAVAQPALHRAFVTLLPAVKSLLVTALLVVLWRSVRALSQRDEPHKNGLRLQWWVGLPAVVLLLSLTMNLVFSRNLVSRVERYDWQPMALTSGDCVLQELHVEWRQITGIRLRLTEASPSAALEVCMFRDDDASQEPLVCATRNTTEQVENGVLYFPFEKTIALENDAQPVARIQIQDAGATAVLPYTTSVDRSLQHNGTHLTGSLDMSALSSFSITAAFNTLIIENIVQDTWLLATIGVVTTLVALFLGIVVSSSQIPIPVDG
jgi:hypothetical protein